MLGNLPFFKKKEIQPSKEEIVKQHPVPKHIAIIMDGNGRWAKNRALPRIAGHKEGMNVVKKITMAAKDMGVEVLTLYAFSTENWKRPKNEVDFLMKLPEQFMDNFLPDLIKNNVRVQTIGRFDELPTHTKLAVMKAKEETKNNTGLILNFALNYGSRDEIIEAVRVISADVANGKISSTDINDELLSSHLMTHPLPDPDLLIRTSGEIRISNFMMWQISYSELWFTNVLWPDFTREHLIEAIYEFQQRHRRFGGV